MVFRKTWHLCAALVVFLMLAASAQPTRDHIPDKQKILATNVIRPGDGSIFGLNCWVLGMVTTRPAEDEFDVRIEKVLDLPANKADMIAPAGMENFRGLIFRAKIPAEAADLAKHRQTLATVSRGDWVTVSLTNQDMPGDGRTLYVKNWFAKLDEAEVVRRCRPASLSAASFPGQPNTVRGLRSRVLGIVVQTGKNAVLGDHSMVLRIEQVLNSLDGQKMTITPQWGYECKQWLVDVSAESGGAKTVAGLKPLDWVTVTLTDKGEPNEQLFTEGALTKIAPDEALKLLTPAKIESFPAELKEEWAYLGIGLVLEDGKDGGCVLRLEGNGMPCLRGVCGDLKTFESPLGRAFKFQVSKEASNRQWTQAMTRTISEYKRGDWVVVESLYVPQHEMMDYYRTGTKLAPPSLLERLTPGLSAAKQDAARGDMRGEAVGLVIAKSDRDFVLRIERIVRFINCQPSMGMQEKGYWVREWLVAVPQGGKSATDNLKTLAGLNPGDWVRAEVQDRNKDQAALSLVGPIQKISKDEALANLP